MKAKSKVKTKVSKPKSAVKRGRPKKETSVSKQETQPEIVETNSTQPYQKLRETYPNLSNEDLTGTSEEVTAKVSAKTMKPYSEIEMLIKEQ